MVLGMTNERAPGDGPVFCWMEGDQESAEFFATVDVSAEIVNSLLHIRRGSGNECHLYDILSVN